MKTQTEECVIGRVFKLGLVGLGLFVLSLASYTDTMAAQTTYYFAGALDESFGTLPVGTPFCGSFRYDASQPTNTPVIPYRGDYNYKKVKVIVGGEAVMDHGPGAINVYDHGDGYPPDPMGNTTGYPTDLFHLYPFEIAGALGGITLTPGAGIQIVLQDEAGAVFSDPSVMAPGLNLSDFTVNATFLQLQGAVIMPPFPFPQIVSARGALTYLSNAHPKGPC